MVTQVEVGKLTAYAVIKPGYSKAALGKETSYAVVKPGYSKAAVGKITAYAIIQPSSLPWHFSRWDVPARPKYVLPGLSQFQPGIPTPDPVAGPPPSSWMTSFGQPLALHRVQEGVQRFPLSEPTPDPVITPDVLSWHSNLWMPVLARQSAGSFQEFIPLDLTPAASADTLSWLTPLDATARKRKELDLEAGASGFGFVVPAPPEPYVPDWYTAFSVRPAPMAMHSSWLITTRDLQISPPLPFRKPFVRGYVLT
jgi:hypothetical protein